VTWKKYKNWTHLAAPCIYIIVQIGLIAQHTKIVHYISPCATLFFQPSYILLFFCCMFTAVYHSVLNLAMPKCTHNEASSCQVYIIAIPLYCSIQSTLPWSLILIEQHESWIICNDHLVQRSNQLAMYYQLSLIGFISDVLSGQLRCYNLASFAFNKKENW